MTTLHFDVSDGPMRTEYERVLRTVLRRGDVVPERQQGEFVDTKLHSEQSLHAARNVWLSRMASEHQSAAVFTGLVPQLMEIGASNDMKMTLLRMAMDELRHGALCAGVVEALGTTAELDLDLRPAPVPEHEGASPLERAVRNVMFTSCLAETIAVAFTAAERETTSDPLVKRAITQISADEVLHARFGWAFLKDVAGDLSARDREGINAWLRVAFAYLEREEMLEVPNVRPPSSEVALDNLSLGVCENDQTRELFYETVHDVIVPGLAALNFASQEAWEERSVINSCS